MFFNKKKEPLIEKKEEDSNVLGLQEPNEDPEEYYNSGIESKVSNRRNPLLIGYVERFFAALKSLNPIKKVDLIYKHYVKKLPAPGMTLSKKLNRIIYEQEFGEKIKETEAFLKNEKKQFKFSYRHKKEMKDSLKPKNAHKILVMFITITNELMGPKLYPIYSGNMVIINSKPYELDPRAVLRFGKHRCLIIKEIDRRPVSNLDLDEIKRRGDSTSSDEFLIKAAMKAQQTAIPKKEMNKTVIIIIILVVVGALLYFFTR